MRILSVGWQGPYSTASHRTEAMRRLGHRVTAIDVEPFLTGAGRLANWLRMRTMIGPAVSAINRAVRAAAAADRFDLIWLDKPIWIRPATLRALRQGGAAVVSYMPDNPFGPRGDPGWRLFLASLTTYDAIAAPNPTTIPHYVDAGVRHAILMPFGFEPAVHHPPPAGWSDRDRDVDVCFIGTPYDERADFIRRLADGHGIAVRVWGEPGHWRRVFGAAEMDRLHAGSAAYGDAYREAIWRSKICLGFVTRSNLDTFAHRWFEIAGAGGFLLAERTDDGLRSFAGGREAAFFGDLAECVAMIRRYLPDEAARAEIARAGHARAMSSGYDYASRLRRVFDALAARGVIGGG